MECVLAKNGRNSSLHNGLKGYLEIATGDPKLVDNLALKGWLRGQSESLRAEYPNMPTDENNEAIVFYHNESVRSDSNNLTLDVAAVADKIDQWKPVFLKDSNSIVQADNPYFLGYVPNDNTIPVFEESIQKLIDRPVALATVPIKEGVPELFESNPELANEVYSKILTNSDISAENLLSLLEKENIVEKDCSGGKLKAKDGISTLFDKGSKWEIVTDFKNAPTHKSGGKDISIQGKKVEVEKNELRIENDFGDVAVIPSKYRIEVQDAIKSNCHSCIDGIVESLPKMKDYAGDGTVFPFFGRYKRFKNSLPDNLKNTPEDEYAMRYYWKHSNKPKSFDDAINREQPMFTMEDDGYYHAPSVEPNTLRFLKPKTHPTLQYELDWYNSDNPEAVDFRNKYDLDTSDKFYRYIPKKR